MRSADRDERNRIRAGSRTLAIVFVGTLLLLLLAGGLADTPDWQVAVQVATTALLAAAATRSLGPRSLRPCLGRRPTGADLGLATVAAGATVTVSLLWVGLVAHAVHELDLPPAEAVAPPTWPEVVAIAVAVPIVEEWLCRGVAWLALRRLHGRTTTLLLTATIFALLHGLNGAAVFELPHRFASGLALSWLRDRTGGLAAPVLAHALHNAVALALA